MTVIAHEEARPLLRGGRNDLSRGGGFVSRRMAFLAGVEKRFDRRWTETFPPFDLRPEDITITGDDTALPRTLGIEGSILTTPGHTADHLALLLDTGEAFCGDAAARMFLWAGSPAYTRCPRRLADPMCRMAMSQVARAAVPQASVAGETYVSGG